MGPESVTVSEISEQYGYSMAVSAETINPVHIAHLQCAASLEQRSSLHGEDAEESQRPQPIPAAILIGDTQKSL